ncbi:hypothetical protein Droror1_Dr00025145 [Drosera rotundifolia]
MDEAKEDDKEEEDRDEGEVGEPLTAPALLLKDQTPYQIANVWQHESRLTQRSINRFLHDYFTPKSFTLRPHRGAVDLLPVHASKLLLYTETIKYGTYIGHLRKLVLKGERGKGRRGDGEKEAWDTVCVMVASKKDLLLKRIGGNKMQTPEVETATRSTPPSPASQAKKVKAFEADKGKGTSSPPAKVVPPPSSTPLPSPMSMVVVSVGNSIPL